MVGLGVMGVRGGGEGGWEEYAQDVNNLRFKENSGDAVCLQKTRPNICVKLITILKVSCTTNIAFKVSVFTLYCTFKVRVVSQAPKILSINATYMKSCKH